MKAIKFLFAFIFFIFFFAKSCFAVTITITNFPSSISDQPFTVTASVSGATTGTNYLRIDLYKEGTSNYFGQTYNGSNWYSGGDGTLFFPITIDSSKNGSGTFQGLVGTPNTNDYPGPGDYKLTIRRYTSSGSQASGDTQTPVDVNITYASPTPNPTPTITPAPTEASTPIPTNSPTQTPTPTKIPTKTPTKTPFPTNTENFSTSSVLGQNTSDASKGVENPKKVEVASVSENILPKIFIALGIIFLIACVGIISYPYIQKFKEGGFGNEE